MTARDEAVANKVLELIESARKWGWRQAFGGLGDKEMEEQTKLRASELAALLTTRQEVAPDFWAIERGCAALMGGDVWASFHPDHKAGLRKLLRDALSTGRAASGQEVAPVAWGLMYPDDHPQRGQLWNVAVEKESAEQMKSACWNAGYDVIVPLYTSTGQASDARDGVVAELLAAAKDIRFTKPTYSIAYGNAEKRLDNAIAAMQEAGK